MISSKAKFSFVLIPMFLLYPFFSFGQGPGNGAPFRMGEVVVGGPPSDLPPGTTVVKYLPHANLTVVGVETGKEWGMVQKYRLKGKRAGLNYIAKASFTPNDQYYGSYQWNFRHIQSEEAWHITHGEGVTIAVLDTGLAPGGRDGIGCVSPGYDVVNHDDDPLDRNGHGTHVSGTIAQNTNNGVGVAGLAYASCIMPVKVLDDSGSGTFADIAEGIRFAVDGPDDAMTNDGAHVINMSLGTDARFGITSNEIMDPALAYAREKGVTVVCAAGNEGWSSNVSYPAININTIAVGATGPGDTRVSYSNYGLGLDIMAPGGDMTVDLDGNGSGDGILQETIGKNGRFGYFLYQGTSMAAPHVSAVAALIISAGLAQQPSVAVDPASVYERITSTALDLDPYAFDSQTANGLVQAADALNYSPCTDSDRDGYCSGDDCNDTNSFVNPGVDEVCGDNIDNNCNKATDENPPCAQPTCIAKNGPCTKNTDCCSRSCLRIKKICL